MIDDQELAGRLSRLDACAVSDALDKLSLSGCVTGLIASQPGKRICGRVHTVKLLAGTGPATGGPPRHLCTAAIEACSPGEIIVIEQRTRIDAGSWGGLLSRGAKLRGIAGVVVDGPVRDVDEARQLDFPLFCRGFTARTARGRIYEAATDVAVQIGDVTVNPGDYVVADSSAAVFIARERVEEVLAAAEAIAAREAAMAQRLQAGEPITQVMGGDYEHMLRK
ncbi:MAG TPA: RraA family protein [Steroidobacteraceae bacterium]